MSKYYSKLLVLICLIFVLSIGAASAADITDDSLLADDGDTFTDLQNEIDTNDNLILNQNYTFNDASDKNITVDKSMTIDGNGFTIDGLNKTNILVINASQITLKNINFVNYNGTALYFNNTDNAVIENCKFMNANTFEGSIFFNGGNLTLTNCEFINISTVHNSTYQDGSTKNNYTNVNVTGYAFMYVNSSENVVIKKSKFTGSNFITGVFINNTANAIFDEIASYDNGLSAENYAFNSTSNTTYINAIYNGGYMGIFGGSDIFTYGLLAVSASNVTFTNSKSHDDALMAYAIFNSSNITVKSVNITNSGIQIPFYFMLNAEVPNSTDLPSEAYLNIEDVNILDCDPKMWGYMIQTTSNNLTYFEEHYGEVLFYVDTNVFENRTVVNHGGWTSTEYNYVYGKSIANIKNINVNNITGYEMGIFYANYIYNLTFEDVNVSNLKSTFAKGYDDVHDVNYTNTEGEGGSIIYGIFENVKINNVNVTNGPTSGEGEMPAFIISGVTNATITNVVLDTIPGGEDGAFQISSDAWRLNSNQQQNRGNILLENVTISNVITGGNMSYYDFYSGQYTWYTGMSEGGGILSISASNSNVQINNLNVDDIKGGGEEGGGLRIEAYDVNIENMTVTNAALGYKSFFIQSKDKVIINNLLLDNITASQANESEYYNGNYQWNLYSGEGGLSINIDAGTYLELNNASLINSAAGESGMYLYVDKGDAKITNFVMDNISSATGFYAGFDSSDNRSYWESSPGEGGMGFSVSANGNVELENISLTNSQSGEEGMFEINGNNVSIKNFTLNNVSSSGYNMSYYDSSTNVSYWSTCTGEGGVSLNINAQGNLDVDGLYLTNLDGLGMEGCLDLSVNQNISINDLVMENISYHEHIDCYYNSQNSDEIEYSSYYEPAMSGVSVRSNNASASVDITNIVIKNITDGVMEYFFRVEGGDILVENFTMADAYSGREGALSIYSENNDAVVVNNVLMDNVRASPAMNYTSYNSYVDKYIWTVEDGGDGGAGVTVYAPNSNVSISNITIINSDGSAEGSLSVLANNTEVTDVLIDNIESNPNIEYMYDSGWDTYFENIHPSESASGAKVTIESLNNANVSNLTISNSIAGGDEGSCNALNVYGKNITIEDVNVINITSLPYIYSTFSKDYNMYINQSVSEPSNVIIIGSGAANTTVNINNLNVDNVPGSSETIQLAGTNVTITNSSFKNIESSYEETRTDEQLRKDVVQMSDNEGNGVIVSATNVVISNTTFSDMTLGGNKESGFALLVTGSNNTELDNVTFENINSVPHIYKQYNGNNEYYTDTQESYGSAFSINGNNNVVDNSKFINCSSDYGGALYLTNKVNITDSEFSNNSAKLGGAIYVDNDAYNIINNTAFNENEAIDGGAIYFNITAFNNTVYNSSFVKNRASHNGGALYIIASNQNGTNVINQSTFDHNRAKYLGGAFYFNDTVNRNLYEDYEFYNRSALYSDGPQNFIGHHTMIIDSLYELNEDYPLFMDANDTAYGRNSIAVVRIYDDAEGYVYVNITDMNGNILNDAEGNSINGRYRLTNGRVEFDLGILPVGQYNISGYYDDYDYNNPGDEFIYHINSTLFNVYPHFLNVSANDTIFADENITVNATLNNLTNGEIIFKFNETFEVKMNVTNGTAILNIGGFYPGDYTVNVTYLEDGIFYEISNSTDFTVLSRESLVNVTADNITYGKNATVVVRVPVNQKGNVTITVNDEEYTKEITNGEVSFEIPDLPSDKYEVAVVFEENRIYSTNNNETVFWVNKASMDPSVVANNVSVLDNLSFIISNLPDDFKGNVSIEVDGETYDGAVADVIEMGSLLAGNKTAKITFYGDDNYNETTMEVNFTVSTTEVDINASIDDVVYPNDAEAVIELSGPANGTVKIIISDDEVYEGTVTNGVANIPLTDLSAGIKTATVEFVSQDGFYDNASTTVKFFVSQANSTLDVSVDDNGDIVAVVNDDATGNVSIIVNGEEYSVPIENGKAVLKDVEFNEGNNSIIAVYEGDDNYKAAFDKTTYEVTPSEKINATMDISVEDGVVTVDVGEDATGNVTIIVNGEEYSVPIENGKAVLKDVVLEEGNNAIVAVYDGDDNYNPGVGTENVYEEPLSVEKIDPNMYIDVENDTITVGVGEGATGNVTIIVNGKEYSVPIKIDTAVLEGVEFNEGNNTIVAVYDGDDVYNPAHNDTVYELETPEVKNKTDILMGIDVKEDSVVITVPDDATGNITVSVNGKESTIPIENGKAVLEDAGLVGGNNTIVASFDGDDNYNGAEVKVLFNRTANEKPVQNKTDASMDISVENGTVTVVVGDNATGNVTVIVNGEEHSVPIVDGKATLDGVAFNDGNNSIMAVYEGDDTYKPAFNKTTYESIPDEKANPLMNVSVDDNTITVDVDENATGNVAVIVNGEEYSVPIVDGKATLDISDLAPGEYPVEIAYSGDDKYAPATVNTTINKGHDLVITAPDVVKYYSGPDRFVVYTKDDKGNNVDNVTVVITINGVSYTRTTSNGETSIALNLNCGNYTVKVDFAGNGKFKAQSVNSSVEILHTIYANDLLKVYRNATQFWALFTDSEGNPLADTMVTFNINGVFYNRTTNATGWAKLNINLDAGSYILTSYNSVTGEECANNVTVFTLIESSDLTKYHRNGSHFIVRVRGADGNWAKAGEEVKFNINGVFYTRYTNETGHAQLNINIQPGEYIITTYYKDCVAGNLIKVLPRLVTSDLVMSYGDGSVFTAKTLDEQGNAAPNQNVTFNIYGVLYDRTTDGNGETRIPITLMPGKYLITSNYLFEVEANNVTVRES